MDYRQCRTCNRTFPATPEHFVRGKGYRFGLAPLCKECQRNKSAAYRSANKEKMDAARKRWKNNQRPERTVWRRMRERCFSESSKEYKHYGGRGIIVCTRWKESFEAFMADLGPRPTKKHELDRINNDGNYSCGHCSECKQNYWIANCRWATRKEQTLNTRRNRRLTAFGETKTATEWADQYGLKLNTLLARLSYGWEPEEAISTPTRRRNITINGETKPLAAWAKEYGLEVSTVFNRINAGWDAERALTEPPDQQRLPKEKRI